MIHKLHVGENFFLPVDTVTQTLVVYGGKGSGKTNFGGVLVEELYKSRQRFCVIDPMGVWWGLQHGCDRHSPGLEVLLLGGPHGDLPIEPTAGAVVADLVVDETVSVVIDISRHANLKAWGKAERIRFVTDYCTRLYERQSEKRRPLMQIIDEAARYAPQELRSGDSDAARCLGIIESLCEEGRNIGIGMTFLTLRSARLNKAVAELAECMVAFRTIGPNSVKAVMDWLGEHVEKERHKDLMAKIRSNPVGHALVVSPGWLQFEGVVAMRLRETFDSSKTPSTGGARRAPTKARKPDLAKYQERMQETIEKAKQNDPKELQKQLRELTAKNQQLQRQLDVKPKPEALLKEKTVTKEKIVYQPVLRNKELDRLHQIQLQFQKAIDKLEADVPTLTESLRHAEYMVGEIEEMLKPCWRDRLQRDGSLPPDKPKLKVVSAPKPAKAPAPPKLPKLPNNVGIRTDTRRPPVTSYIASDNGARDNAGERDADKRNAGERILDAVAWWEWLGVNSPDRAQVGMIAQVGYRGGYFDRVCAPLVSAGYITRSGGSVRLQPAGREKARAPSDIADLSAYLANIRGQVGRAATRKMFDALVRKYQSTGTAPVEMTRGELGTAAQVGYAGGYFDRAIAPLSRLGLVDRKGGVITTTSLMFPEKLT